MAGQFEICEIRHHHSVCQVRLPEIIRHVQTMQEVVSFPVALLVTMYVLSARTCMDKGQHGSMLEDLSHQDTTIC